MNMSDDVTGVTLQIVQKGADVAAHAAKEFIDLLMRIFAELGRQRERSRANAASNPASQKAEKPSVSSTDLTDIKTGRVEMKTLRDNAKTIGDTLSMSENALTQEDMKFIAKKAKAYGIPVAFSNEHSKDNIFASVRTGDLPLFKQICTEMMKSKIAERPQELHNFYCEAWEIPFLTAHFNQYDLSAQFIQTKDGSNICVFEKKDRKAIEMRRDTFVKECREVKNDLSFDRDEAGFITIKNLRTGKEISFDQIPDKKMLAAEIQKAFGYEDIKAKIAAARFGEEMLQGESKAKFFSESAQQECSQIDANVTVEGEDSVCKEYQCWRVIPKSDEKPRIIFQNDNGEFAVLEPAKMTRVQMRHALEEQLGITDRKTQDALIHKAESIESFHAQHEAHTAEYTFSRKDFDLSDVRVAMGLRKTDDEGNTIYTKQLPVSSMSSEINRTEKDFFCVNSTVTAIETDADGVDHERHDRQELVLSFSDKKSALQQLREMYVAQGVPDHVAKQMAKDVFRKAAMQNPEKPIQIQDIREKSLTVAYGTQSAEVSISDKIAAAERITETLGVPAETAAVVVEKAEEIAAETAAVETEEAKTEAPEQQAPPRETPEEAADRKKRVAAFSQAANVPEEQAESILQKAKEQAQTGTQGGEVGFHMVMGDVYLGTQENYTASIAESLGVSTEEAGQIIETADTNYLTAPDEALAVETALGGNGHEAHPEGNILGEAAAGIGKGGAPEVPVPELSLPELPPPSMGGRR